MSLHVHEEVLAAANQIAAQRSDWTFSPQEIVQALPVLNESSVRTHIVSRCCVNAPRNHLHKWDYFRRVARGRYEIRSKYRTVGVASAGDALPSQRSTHSKAVSEPGNGMRREVIHAVVHRGDEAFTAQCLEISAVTQGETLDETLHNLNEVVALYFEGEDLAAMGFSERLRLQVFFETPLTL